MPRYFLEMRYDGTAYHGWQVQQNSKTIQAEINTALGKMLNEDVTTTGAGRTDTGVHAEQLFCHFDCSNEIADIDKILFGLNSILPNDISVTGICSVNKEAHARFSATKRTYRYLISKEKNPFLINKAWIYRPHLDLKLMNDACEILKSHKHFASFSKSGVQVKTDICNVDHAQWSENGSLIQFDISADRFLRNMVRAIVGTMLDVGQEKINLRQFEDIILSKKRSMAGTSVPAHGLYLTKITYPKNLFN